MEEGKALDKTKTGAAITGKGLQMTAFEKANVVVPEAGYVLAVTGTG